MDHTCLHRLMCLNYDMDESRLWISVLYFVAAGITNLMMHLIRSLGYSRGDTLSEAGKCRHT